jgi:hypothetical protein
LEQVELATAEWVDWWNQRRLHTAIDDLPPVECAARYCHQHEANQAARFQPAAPPPNSGNSAVFFGASGYILRECQQFTFI